MRQMVATSCALLIALSISAQNGNNLWPAPLPEARPAARWWWMGSAVDSANLTRNIAAYAKAGLGGLEITPIYGVQGNEVHDIPYLSPRWMQMLGHTQTLGARHGVEIDMSTGTGWPFGGPKVTAQDAAAKLLVKEWTVKGGIVFQQNIEYVDGKKPSVATLSRLMAFRLRNNKTIEAEARKADDVLDLTSKVIDNQISTKLPKGEWQVIALYVGRTGQKVKRAAPGGEGYVIDHFAKGAVQRYLHTFDEAFEANATAYPHTFFNDSYEVYGADWTPDLLTQFETQHGYKLERYLPEFLDSTDVSHRIIADYRETLSDLLLENFTTQWTAWAHNHGSLTRNQAHGSPANLIDVYAAVDIPECEGFGLSQFHIKGLRTDSLTRPNFSDLSMLKYASSAAHITGKQFTSSETFTWLTEHFRVSLSQCKPDADLMFVSGVNHLFFHGTPYSPSEAPWPGWQFYASINMSPTNSIWRDAPAFFQYITRCQSFLQMGQSDADFLVYLPVYDMWHEQPGRLLQFDIHSMAKRAPQFISTVHAIVNAGYDVDYISDKYLQTTNYVDGGLQTAAGTRYKAIIVPNAKRMPMPVLKHLLALAETGATVVFLGGFPTDVPGFGNYKERHAQFIKIENDVRGKIGNFGTLGNVHEAATQYGKGHLIIDSLTDKTLAACGTQPEDMRTRFGLSCIRRRNETGWHYFISSLQDKGVDDWVTLAIPARTALLFDPMTGSVGRAQMRQRDGHVQVRLQLQSGESVILQTYTDDNAPAAPEWLYLNESAPAQTINLDKGWTLRFVESTPTVKGTFALDAPCSWTDIKAAAPDVQKALQTTMGTGLYAIDFHLPETKADEWMLCLGDVRESARVRINGVDAGCVWAAPFRLRVGKYLRKGKNHLEVEVTNLPANRIAQMDRDGKEWRIFKEINVVDLNYKKKKYSDWMPMPSGLNGEVKLISLPKENF